MANPSSASSILDDFLRNFVYNFVYLPTTNWQHFFSPTLYFGCNVEDIGVEQHVLSRAGSYGSQLNRIIDVVSILVSGIDSQSLTPEQQEFVDRFKALAVQTAQASAEYQGKPRHTVTAADVDGLMKRIAALKAADPSGYEMLVNRVRIALPNAP